MFFKPLKAQQKQHTNTPPRPWVGIRNISDYSPFGVLLKERTVESGFFRLGFQAQERDDEIHGEGNYISFKYRGYDPRIGRFFAVDPLTATYPYLTPYQFASNSPIYLIELEGLEGKIYLFKIWYTEGDVKNSLPMGVITVDGLKSDLIKSVYFPYGKPNSEPIEVSYNIRLDDGYKGTGTGTYKLDEKPTVSELNEIFGDNLPKKEEPEETNWYDGTIFAPDALDGNSDPANLGDPKALENIGKLIMGVTQGCLEYVQRRVALPMIVVDPTLLSPPTNSLEPAPAEL